MFQYDPLPADDPRVLRVLNILPGKISDPSVRTMEFVSSLPDDGRGAKFESLNYEALSYVLGNSTPT